MKQEIHKNSIVQFTVQVSDSQGTVDISGTSTKQLILQKPNKYIATFDTTFSTDGTDGQIYYNTTSDDFDQPGLYRYQIYLEFTGGSAVHSDIGEFRVYPNLELF